MHFSANEKKMLLGEQYCVKKAPGYDHISPKMPKELPFVAMFFISKLFNAILSFSYFPEVWKMSLISMTPQPGKDPTVTSSYRPISLLPCLSKVFERALLSKLMPYINEQNIIPAHQFGFRKNHGTIGQVNRITNEIRNAFEKKEYCTVVFLDVAKAFDKVWHEGLILKKIPSSP